MAISTQDRVGGQLVAIGLVGVLITSALYAASPPATALPEAYPDMAAAFAGAIPGSVTIRAAGLVGIIGDVLFAAGAAMLCCAGGGRSPTAAAGWAMIAICGILFTIVDGIAAFALIPSAASQSAPATFAAVKLVFDAMFFAGTVATGMGLLIVFAEERAAVGLLRWAGIAAGSACLIGIVLALTGKPSGQAIGLALAGSALTGALLGRRISRGVVAG